jgi:molybdopterin molybdotransferase
MPGELITVAEARERVLAAVRPLQPERVGIHDALDRVLAQAIHAAADVPPFASSAMDGYAIASSTGGELTVVGESRAGAPSGRRVNRGEAIRISTGAPVPLGASAVVAQEEVELRGERIVVRGPVPEGQHIRAAGEALRAGTALLAAGTVLDPAALGAAVTAGLGEVLVGRRPTVQVLATGDELREPGAELGPGQIHNSNAPMLAGLAAHAGALLREAGQLPDDSAATEEGLAAALASADVVIVCGGVSVGPHDHVKAALSKLGVRELFWGVALQPGKPTWFGTRDQTLVFGLPGNPVSAAVTFSLFAAPALAALQGAAGHELEGDAVLGEPVPRNRSREQALRVRLEHRNGVTIAVPNGAQGSHVITSLLGADALALIPPGEGSLEPGTRVALAALRR